ncbi:hypothetical protein BASA61_001248 [Batrachochytrium salamandrivorans]|nr:hypothetical protein BASA61_001248 [Batrachochytrium salamandrivorans]
MSDRDRDKNRDRDRDRCRDMERGRGRNGYRDRVIDDRRVRGRDQSRSRSPNRGRNANNRSRSRSRSWERQRERDKADLPKRDSVEPEKIKPVPLEKKLPWGVKQAQPGSIKPLSKEKLETFSVGIQKKSAFQKQKEAEEAKRKREEEDAARIYEEFAASFDQPTATEKKWIRSSSAHISDTEGGEALGKSGALKQSTSDLKSRVYQPRNAYTAHLATPVGSSSSIVSELLDSSDGAAAEAALPRAPKRRNLDAFLEELKKDNAETGKRVRSSDQSPHKDMATTNVFVGNLAKAINEEDLCLEFGIFGPIASVKVMKPLNLEELKRERKWGFVCFMEHADAAAAIKALTGKQLQGVTMNIDWGKPIAAPDRPYYVMPEHEVRRRKELKAIEEEAKQRLAGGRSDDIHVSIPDDTYILMVIHRTIERVLKYGFHFEVQLMERSEGDPDFSFLLDTKQGDSFHIWSAKPFAMVEGGPMWVPPPTPFDDECIEPEPESSSDDDSDESESESSKPVFPKGSLTAVKRLRFEGELRRMTLERTRIAHAMVLCIKHSDASDEVLDILMRSLLVPSTPLFPTKLGRLYLLSDLLHNSGSSVPNAWRYRSNLQKRLPKVFSHFGTVWKVIESRLKAEQFRKAVMAVLAAWEGWMIFTPGVTEELRQAFSAPTKDASSKGDSTLVNTHDRAQSASTDQEGSIDSNEAAVAAKFVKSRFAPIADVGLADTAAPTSVSTTGGLMVSSFSLSSKHVVDPFASHDVTPRASIHHAIGLHAPASLAKAQVVNYQYDSMNLVDSAIKKSDIGGRPSQTLKDVATHATESHLSDDEDLDGVPLEATMNLGSGTQDDGTDDDEDLDGMPMIGGSAVASGFANDPLRTNIEDSKVSKDTSFEEDDMFGL